LAVTVGALAAAFAWCAVEEVLLHCVASVAAELGRGAREDASLSRAGVCVVVRCQAAHQRLALLIARRTPARRALQSSARVATGCAVVSALVLRADRRTTRARLLRIAAACARAADSAGALELTLLIAAFFVRWIAYAAVSELAGGWVAALIAGATLSSAAVAIFALFHDAVTALTTRDGRDIFVICETRYPRRVAAEEAADIANAAGGELCDTRSSRGVHDELAIGIARAGLKWAALLLRQGTVRARLRITVMNSAKCMTRLMSEDQPFLRCADHNVCAGNRLVRSRLRARLADLAKPGQANGGECVAGGEQSPICVIVLPLATPRGKHIQAVSNRRAAAAGTIPRGSCWWSPRAFSLTDSQVLNTEGDVECAFV